MKKLLTLILVAGIVAAGWYAYTNYWLPAQDTAKQGATEQLPATDKDKQKQTMSDMRSIYDAVFKWRGDRGHPISFESTDYSQSAKWLVEESGGNLTLHLEKYSYETMAKNLHPNDTYFYMQDVPKYDGWGNEFEYYVSNNLFDDNFPAEFLIRSPGRDGKYSDKVAEIGEISAKVMSYTKGTYDASRYDDDIVFANGSFWGSPKN